ncbi:hypothetical protein EXIGLDRAFT_756465 [Exidia glandulosa HHB12029]|uniref:Uncharacterized protein n=1 Tax=Exidia glandulosa HHB12029 TaxID=1314781 RepID=A0A165B9P3_EXIGL|nr:hypothetical protein EXIGLDRAFT_756465 [Exidia glandulosa HHB12029]
MVFAFTFNVPTIPNPFSIQQAPVKPEDELEEDMGNVLDRNPRPRKRAWMPVGGASSTASLAVSSATSEPAYMDTPSKYLDAVASASGPGDDDDEGERELGPPMKKRRTIADSIVSTALSAALIGAAVGIAAYRVWRDRGKSSQAGQETDDKHAPPPPYHPGDWVSVTPSQPVPGGAASQHHTLPKAARRTRRTHAAGASSSHRRKPSHLTVHAHSSRRTTPPPPSVSPRRSHFSPASMSMSVSDAGSEATEFDEHVDWMGSQLSRLIAEGKRALGQEVVLPSDPSAPDETSADDEDDQDAWEDEHQQQQQHPHHYSSMSSSYRAHGSHLRPTSPFLNTPPRSPLTHSSSTLHTPVSSVLRDDDDTLSPELRDIMARARSTRGRH